MARKQQAHDLVAEVCRRVEHEWTTTVDRHDAILTAVGSGRSADAAFAVDAMHPHVFDAELRAVSHRAALSLPGRGRDDDGLDTTGNAPQVVIAARTLDLL